MPTYIAMLRGINVGKANRIPMAELKTLFDRMGYKQVCTLLNSGNVVFNGTMAPSDTHANAITSALKEQFNLEVPVVVKSADEFEKVILENKILTSGTNPSLLLVIFSQDSGALTALKAIAPLVKPPEEFYLGTYGAFLTCAPSIHESQAGKALLSKRGEALTTRNWATVLKLQALVHQLPA